MGYTVATADLGGESAPSSAAARIAASTSAGAPSIDPQLIEPLDYSAVLTHHWLVRMRGGEKVLQAFRALLPEAPIYTLVHDPAAFDEAFFGGGHQPPRVTIRTSFLQHIPGALRHYPKLLPLMPLAARSVRLPPVDLVLCSDAAMVKAMSPHARSRVICYCHSPMRYVYEEEISREYAATLPAVMRPMWPGLCRYLRAADQRAARRVDAFIANSATVAERIRQHYGRESVVVHPPVDVPDSPPEGGAPREDFYLCVGHHVAYKRLELAVQACTRLGRRLIVIGEGPDVARLRPQRIEGVTFLGWQPDAVVADHYRRARGLLFPGEEDFGMVPVEAMGHGCPVIAFGRGGATETVVEGVSGVLYQDATLFGLIEALRRFETLCFDATAICEIGRRFGRAGFFRRMREVIQSVERRAPLVTR